MVAFNNATFDNLTRGDQRDDFSKPVKELLAKRVGTLCSRPGCFTSTHGPSSDPDRVVNIGVAAHIAAASPGGPRYDPLMSDEERGCVSNGIWLCQSCAKLIDSDEALYTTRLILSWKVAAEAAAQKRVEAQGTVNNNGIIDETLKEVVRQLRELKSQQSADMLKRFPLGYTLFTITGAKNFIPLDSESDGFVDWNSGQQILAMSRTSMAIRLPRIIRPVIVEPVSVNLERKKGARFRIDVGEPGQTRAFIKGNPDIDGNIGQGFGGMTLSANPKYSICLEILDLEAWGDVLVLGVKRYEPAGAPKFQAIRVD
jgi:hypothetical protein